LECPLDLFTFYTYIHFKYFIFNDKPLVDDEAKELAFIRGSQLQLVLQLSQLTKF